MATRRLGIARRVGKGGWAQSLPAGSSSDKSAANAGLAALPRPGRLLAAAVALALCVAGLVSAAPPAGAATGTLRSAASRASALATRRALVRREASPAGEHAAARAAETRLSASRGKQMHAQLRGMAAKDRAAAEKQGIPGAGVSRPPLLGVPGPAAVPAAAVTGDLGEPTDVAVTGPGGATLASDCFGECFTKSMVAFGEPVTMSAQIFNNSDPPVSEQVQVTFIQLCLGNFETMATTTVTAPSTFGGTAGTPVSATFAILPASCYSPPPATGLGNYQMSVQATPVGGLGGETNVFFFNGSIPPSQTQGCICSPDSSGAAAAQDFRGDAVDTATGEYTDSFTDATTSSPGVPLAVQRNYSSGVTAAGPMGPGWTMPWFASLSVNPAAGTITFNSENGSQYTYASNGEGAFTAPLGALSVLTEVTGSSGSVTGYKLTTPQQDVLSFTASGQLTSHLDPAGRGLTFAYTSGQLSSVTGAAGQAATLTYTGSLLSGIRLPNGTSISYGYSGRLLTSVVTPTATTGATTAYTYNSAGLLTTIVNPDGSTVLQNAYNPAGQVTQSEDGTGAATTFSYTTVNGLNETDTTDPDGGVWTDVYGGGMLLQTIDPRSGTTEYVPGDLLAPVQVTDPLGRVTTLAYDGAGNLLSETDPLGRQQSWTYDSSSNMLTYTDGNSDTTTLTYNPMDEVTSVTSASGGKATFTYTSAGNLATSVDPRGNVSGATAANFTTTYAYTAAGRLSSVTNPAGGKETFGYNAMGFPGTVTDPAALVTKYGYNDQQQVTSITAPDGGVTSYGFDAAGNLTSRTDPDSHAWTYAYDADSRGVKATDPLGKSVAYAYDGDGNQTTFTDARGRTATTAYDAGNQPLKITYSDGTPAVSYSYDADGDVTSVTDATGTRTLAYDADGELTSGGGFSYAYDAGGNVTSRTYPDKTAVADTYNSDEELASVSRGSSKTTYTYDAAASLATAVQPDGVTQALTYNGAGRLTKLSDATSSKTLDSYGLTLNADGEPTAAAVTLNGTAQASQSYTYDPAGRLATAGSTRYAYDPAGNLTSATAGSTATTYAYNADEELAQSVTGSATTTYGYNADGDQDAAGSNSYSWNAANEMSAADTSAGSATYKYDAGGDLSSTSLGGSVVKGAVWDINNALPEVVEDSGSSGATTADYAYGADGLLASMSTSAGTFNPVTDWLGSVTGLVSSAGTQATKTSYSAYGAASTTNITPGAPSSSIGFGGSYTVPDSGGLDNMRARDYNPATGSFTGVDPMLAVTGQPYAYASDAPGYYTDPSGRVFGPDNLIAGAIGAIAGAGGTLLNELAYGKKIKWSIIAIAAASGFVFGVVADECGNICAGAASGFVTDGLTQIVNHRGFSGFSGSELASETAQGATAGTIDEYLGNGGGKHAAEDTAALVSKYNLPDISIGAADPAAIAGNPLGALCALIDNPSDGGM
jgi:RHS repeat-associated protein